MTTLRAEVTRRPDGTIHAALIGALDERSDVAQLFAELDADTTINLRRVERVNSIGIHRWIPCITKLSGERRVEVEEIPYSLVLSANSVADLFGAAVVRSCLAPYYCDRCGHDRIVVVTSEDVVAAGRGVPERRCPDCSGAMAFDELDTYFKFMRPRPVAR